MKVDVLVIPNLTEKKQRKLDLFLSKILEVSFTSPRLQPQSLVLPEMKAVIHHYHKHIACHTLLGKQKTLQVFDAFGKSVFADNNLTDGWEVYYKADTKFVPFTALDDTDTEIDVVRQAFPEMELHEIHDLTEAGTLWLETKTRPFGDISLVKTCEMNGPMDVVGLVQYLRKVKIFNDQDYITTPIGGEEYT